ncbi:MAG: phosphodiester glycosidase family protein [Clostridia bacterium]|nr:phosphodiester glycosidase family protein [Clostridia bacterium]
MTICAGYKDYNGNAWGMQSVTDQIAAAMAAHAGENFNVIAGTNADFFNMGTGEPTGILVMQGVEYHPVGNEPFFAILKDGSAVIAAKSEYASYSGQIQEAVGANTFLVKNGEIAVSHSSNYMNSRASRTCVGITESGKVVLMVLDGRQEPWSCGGSAEEIAQIMLDAGCVTAVNLDGGGSTTYAAKLEGSDEVTVVNRPSDGFERRVSTSLMIVSSAVISNELDHANLNADNVYMMLGTEMTINAVGVSVSGNSAALPEDPTWVLSDSSIGTMNGNVFMAEDYGDVTVTMMDGEKELGSIELHVVLPDSLAFDPAEFDAVYDAENHIPLTASYNNNDVAMPTDNDWLESLFNFEVEKTNAGSAVGLTFYAAASDCGVRTTKITAHLWEDDDISAEGIIRLYTADEASFDFNNCTAGDRTLAWNRDVTNTNMVDGIYYLDDPNEEMIVEYTFALDMNDLVIPDNIAAALPLVAAFMGESQVNGDTTAWELLLMLAERISPTTTVTVTVNVDPRLELDLSEMMVNCQFFNLTDTIYDEETGQLKLICNWIKVYGPIDPGTANPLCIVSGLKARVREGVDWGENNQIQFNINGDIKYMARLRSSAAYSLAGSEMGHSYGLVPYDNSANLVNDKGAEFSSTHTTFEDSFIINDTDNEGWVTAEDGSQFYYVNNQKLTGIQQVPDPENTGTYIYNFGDDGVSRGKYSGLFEVNGSLYYAVLGERKTSWRFIGDSYYYFSKQTYAALDGEQLIDGYHYTFEEYKLTRGEIVQRGEFLKYMWAGSYYRNGWFILDGHKYCALPSEKLCTGLYRTDPYGGGERVLIHIFGEDGIWHEEIDGFYDHTDGATYLADNGIIVEYPGLVEIDGDLYYFASNNQMIKGRSYWITKTNGILPEKAYDFGPDGKMIRPDPAKCGFYHEDGSIFYYELGVRAYAGLIHLDENTIDHAEDGTETGLADGYYYVRTSGEVVHGRSYWITKTNDIEGFKEGVYYFDDNGRMIDPPVSPDPTDPGEPTPAPTVKNGFYEENNSLFYYVNGKVFYAGLIHLDGSTIYHAADGTEFGLDDGYYYTRGTGEVVHGRSYWITKTNDIEGFKPGAYTFDDHGCMIDPPVAPQPTEPTETPEPTEPTETPEPTPTPLVKEGFYEENNSLFYYVNGKPFYAGLIHLDGSTIYHAADGTEFGLDDGYYYVRGTGEVVHGRSYWITKTNDIEGFKPGAYTFDDHGCMIDPPTV